MLLSINLYGAEKTFTNSIGMEFVLIPAGSFMMGCDIDFEDYCGKNEAPQHKVTFSRSFYIGKYEVTQEQWVEIMGKGSNPSEFKGKSNPVENVSWDHAQIEYAISQMRAMFTFNRGDFVKLHIEYIQSGKNHFGIILSKQISLSDTIMRLNVFLEKYTSEEIKNNIFWI
ncbi:MAG TPA: DUF5615 family PIN-like protein [Thermodesulfovibrionia bacterium]|nr:DUF5615 family PIN-like protein [Thermodesulfovibrionia bacterium]